MIHTNNKENTVAVKAKIRVIKKGEISRAEMPIFVSKQPKKEVARQLAATVRNWVSDLETRKLDEARLHPTLADHVQREATKAADDLKRTA